MGKEGDKRNKGEKKGKGNEKGKQAPAKQCVARLHAAPKQLCSSQMMSALHASAALRAVQ